MAEPSKERIAAALALAEAVCAAARACDAPEGTPPGLLQRTWQARCDALAKAINDLRAAQKDPERSDKRSRWNELGELPVTVMATTSKYPSPAPCPGCAAVRAIVESVDKQHGHRCEDTSLVLSELADEILKVLNG